VRKSEVTASDHGGGERRFIPLLHFPRWEEREQGIYCASQCRLAGGDATGNLYIADSWSVVIWRVARTELASGRAIQWRPVSQAPTITLDHGSNGTVVLSGTCRDHAQSGSHSQRLYNRGCPKSRELFWPPLFALDGTGSLYVTLFYSPNLYKAAQTERSRYLPHDAPSPNFYFFAATWMAPAIFSYGRHPLGA